MPIKTANGSWGLVVPGRPATPSEGHAQTYARIGPESTQRLVTFDNGTAISFGPDDIVDEFGKGLPFSDQVALIDCAIKDCQAVSQRYPEDNKDSDNVVYYGFRTTQATDRTLLRIARSGAFSYLQVPSKFASVSTLVSIYSTTNKSDVTGASHPGVSVDTRFGVLLKSQPVSALQNSTSSSGFGNDSTAQAISNNDEQQRQVHNDVRGGGRGGRHSRRRHPATSQNGRPGAEPGRDPNFMKRHQPTARRAEAEYPRWLDQLNQEKALDNGLLPGDALNRERTLTLHQPNPRPTILHTINASVGDYAINTSARLWNESSNLNEERRVRSSATEHHRSDAFSGPRILPAAIGSERRGSRFFDSRQSSPGVGGGLVWEEGGARSSSAGQ